MSAKRTFAAKAKRRRKRTRTCVFALVAEFSADFFDASVWRRMHPAHGNEEEEEEEEEEV